MNQSGNMTEAQKTEAKQHLQKAAQSDDPAVRAAAAKALR